MIAHGRRNARKGVGILGKSMLKERANPPARVLDLVSAVTQASRGLMPWSEMTTGALQPVTYSFLNSRIP